MKNLCVASYDKVRMTCMGRQEDWAGDSKNYKVVATITM